MADSKACQQLVETLLEEFRNDDVAQIFLGTAILTFANDMLKKNPEHIYQGFIRGRDWIGVANRVLAKNEELFGGEVRPDAPTLL